MVTLIFNGENLFPIAIEHMSYNISYERPGNDRRIENLNGTLSNDLSLSESMNNLNHFENVAITEVTIQKDGIEDRKISFNSPMHLVAMDSYVNANSESVNFNMQCIAITEAEQMA